MESSLFYLIGWTVLFIRSLQNKQEHSHWLTELLHFAWQVLVIWYIARNATELINMIIKASHNQ